MTTKDTETPLVMLRHTDVDLAGSPVLHGIDWQLLEGHHCGIVGANGSGKSTFLALIAGSLWPAPARGRREYDFGTGPLSDAVEARQRIVSVSPELQDSYAHKRWNFRAIEIVASGLYRTDVPRRQPSPAERARALGLLQELGIRDLAQRRFLELSRGEQRRVLIARAMAFAPRVLLLDEPANGLDPAAREHLDVMLVQVAAQCTVVASAHDDADLPSVVGQVVELDGGRIVACRPALSTKTPTRAQTPSYGTGRVGERLIEIESADIWLAGRRVLERLDWTLREGEHWLVRGPNGAGKSSFLRLLHGQLRPALGGRISWPGLGNPRNVWILRQSVGYLSPEFQAAYRFPTTVADCIASGFHASVGLTRRLDGAQVQRVAELLARFALGELAERYLRTLSYGQMRRTLLARAFANRPRVLLLDEPWAGLDSNHMALVGQQLQASMDDGTALVCVSHQADAGQGFTHLLELDAGRVVGSGRITVDSDDATAVPHGN